MGCREAIDGGYNLAIIESLQRRGKVLRYWRSGGLIIYRIAEDITFEDVLEAVREVRPWLREEQAVRDAQLFWSTSVLEGVWSCPED